MKGHARSLPMITSFQWITLQKPEEFDGVPEGSMKSPGIEGVTQLTVMYEFAAYGLCRSPITVIGWHPATTTNNSPSISDSMQRLTAKRSHQSDQRTNEADQNPAKTSKRMFA